jgi:hypothetical protein
MYGSQQRKVRAWDPRQSSRDENAGIQEHIEQFDVRAHFMFIFVSGERSGESGETEIRREEIRQDNTSLNDRRKIEGKKVKF